MNESNIHMVTSVKSSGEFLAFIKNRKDVISSSFQGEADLNQSSLEVNIKSYHIYEGASKDRYFHIAIIDYLQAWDSSKKFERFVKTSILQKDGDKLSAIEPDRYAARFKRFVNTRVLC